MQKQFISFNLYSVGHKEGHVGESLQNSIPFRAQSLLEFVLSEAAVIQAGDETVDVILGLVVEPHGLTWQLNGNDYYLTQPKNNQVM